MITALAEETLQTEFGTYREILFYDGKHEVIAMVLGDVSGKEDVLCRLHSTCLYGHYFNSVECDCRHQMKRSQELIAKAGNGVIILMEQEGKGNGHLALMKSKSLKRQGKSQGDAYVAVGYSKDARDFSAAAKILHYLAIKSVRLLTGNDGKSETLARYGFKVSGTTPLS